MKGEDDAVKQQSIRWNALVVLEVKQTFNFRQLHCNLTCPPQQLYTYLVPINTAVTRITVNKQEKEKIQKITAVIHLSHLI